MQGWPFRLLGQSAAPVGAGPSWWICSIAQQRRICTISAPVCVGVLHPCRRVYGDCTTDAGRLHSRLRWITAAPYEMAITELTVPELLENTAAQCRALQDLIAQVQAQLPGVPLQVQYHGQTVPASGALLEINAQVGVTIEDFADTYGVGLDHPMIAADDEVGMAIDDAARFLTGTHFEPRTALPPGVSAADLVALADLILRRRDLKRQANA